jgi:hypothetical protein
MLLPWSSGRLSARCLIALSTSSNAACVSPSTPRMNGTRDSGELLELPQPGPIVTQQVDLEMVANVEQSRTTMSPFHARARAQAWLR